MKIHLRHLTVITRRTIEHVEFGNVITFIHGPVSKGKSTVARLIDYCFGGKLERTPAIQQEFVAVKLNLILGEYDCTIERAADDCGMRVSWIGPGDDIGSANAPLDSQSNPIVGSDVYNFSDLIFYLCGVEPIKVRKRSRDHESPLIRLSFRDILWYCYLDQMKLDSNFFQLTEPFKGRKSQDAMRFFTGLHSESLSKLEAELMKTLDEQRSKREAVRQIHEFMSKFSLGSEAEIRDQIRMVDIEISNVNDQRNELQQERNVQLHPTDELRQKLRIMGHEVQELRTAVSDSEDIISEQQALRAELITAKTKAERAGFAGRILDGVQFERCPECGSNIVRSPDDADRCQLCGGPSEGDRNRPSLELEALRRDLNDRIDEITDSIQRRKEALDITRRKFEQALNEKIQLDDDLQKDIANYDSAIIESIRKTDKQIAALGERKKSLLRLQQMPTEVNALVERAGALQGKIDLLRRKIQEERALLNSADEKIAAIADCFKEIMLTIGFPGVYATDEVVIDPRNWKPLIIHNDQEWGFWDAGSGGKKTLFNVCYALALHVTARHFDMPVPTVLIIDSPTKNISKDVNPSLVLSLYKELYRIAYCDDKDEMQFLIIDSDMVPPEIELPGFIERRMAGEPSAPSLISYYTGP